MNAAPVSIRLNGHSVRTTAGSLREVLAEMEVDPARRGIAVAVNGAVVPRQAWAEAPVAEGDEVEVIGATQGG